MVFWGVFLNMLLALLTKEYVFEQCLYARKLKPAYISCI